jgi:peptidoglycan biosynthesis protein MviN/MurJ (putative lipid II flippase)
MVTSTIRIKGPDFFGYVQACISACICLLWLQLGIHTLLNQTEFILVIFGNLCIAISIINAIYFFERVVTIEVGSE